jgi:hypothetical protein
MLLFIVSLCYCYIYVFHFITLINMNQPWIVGGDFNMITSLEEKKGGIQKLEAESLSFCNRITKVLVIDIPTSSGLHT